MQHIYKWKSMKAYRITWGTLMVIFLLALGLTACKKEGCTDPLSDNYNPDAEVDNGSCAYCADCECSQDCWGFSGFITSNTTWTADNIYILQGKVVVANGVTLTIQPGTIIKAEEGTGTLASALVVQRGGKINAVGTPSQPIIFTSILDNIQSGQLVGTNLDEDDKGKWGGVIILGNAPVSAANGDENTQIEGIPVTDQFGAYGGSDPSDNSGIMAYVSIRHGGALIGAGNEINGLTLGGVGSGTSISNIEVVANQDDGIEFFGGTVNVSNVIVGFQKDDAIDLDMNYAGTVDNFVVINDEWSDEGIEADGPEGSTHTGGLFTLMNGTILFDGGGTSSSEFKSKAQGTISNVDFGGTVKIRATFENDCTTPKEDAFTHLTDNPATLVFTSSAVSAVLITTNSIYDAGGDCVISTTDQVAAENAIQSTPTAGATLSSFDSWTWLSIKGKL